MDLSENNLSVGQQLELGAVILQITDIPHTGCGQFQERYGAEALKFVNSPVGKQLRLRGVYARVIRNGAVKTGDTLTKTNQSITSIR